MIVTDPRRPDNPIVFCNPAFQQMTGYTFEDIKGKNCRFLQGPKTDKEAVGQIRTAIEDKADVSVDILNYRKDGSTFWNALYISPVSNDKGEVQFFFASQLDVSDRKRSTLPDGPYRQQTRWFASTWRADGSSAWAMAMRTAMNPTRAIGAASITV